MLELSGTFLYECISQGEHISVQVSHCSSFRGFELSEDRCNSSVLPLSTILPNCLSGCKDDRHGCAINFACRENTNANTVLICMVEILNCHKSSFSFALTISGLSYRYYVPLFYIVKVCDYLF